MATGATSRRLREAVVRGARLGYAARGAVYLVIGGLAVTAALGSGRATGTGGAFRFLLAQPFGKGLLAVAALGLLLYATWRVLAGVGDQEGRAGGWRSALARAGHLASGLANLGLAAVAVAVAFPAAVPWGGGQGGGADAWTSAVMREPFGRWLVALAGLLLVAVALAFAVRAVGGGFVRHLRLEARSALVCAVCRAGILARAAASVLIGAFLVTAAWQADPSEARALGGALDALEAQPFGPELLGAVGLGLLAYGLYGFVAARYRRIDGDG